MGSASPNFSTAKDPMPVEHQVAVLWPSRTATWTTFPWTALKEPKPSSRILTTRKAAVETIATQGATSKGNSNDEPRRHSWSSSTTPAAEWVATGSGEHPAPDQVDQEHGANHHDADGRSQNAQRRGVALPGGSHAEIINRARLLQHHCGHQPAPRPGSAAHNRTGHPRFCPDSILRRNTNSSAKLPIP